MVQSKSVNNLRKAVKKGFRSGQSLASAVGRRDVNQIASSSRKIAASLVKGRRAAKKQIKGVKKAINFA